MIKAMELAKQCFNEQVYCPKDRTLLSIPLHVVAKTSRKRVNFYLRTEEDQDWILKTPPLFVKTSNFSHDGENHWLCLIPVEDFYDEITLKFKEIAQTIFHSKECFPLATAEAMQEDDPETFFIENFKVPITPNSFKIHSKSHTYNKNKSYVTIKDLLGEDHTNKVELGSDAIVSVEISWWLYDMYNDNYGCSAQFSYNGVTIHDIGTPMPVIRKPWHLNEVIVDKGRLRHVFHPSILIETPLLEKNVQGLCAGLNVDFVQFLKNLYTICGCEFNNSIMCDVPSSGSYIIEIQCKKNNILCWSVREKVKVVRMVRSMGARKRQKLV